MTKQQLLEEVQVLRSQLPVARPAMPANIKAHEMGANVRQHIIATTQATKKGAVITASVTKGFFAGLFGK